MVKVNIDYNPYIMDFKVKFNGKEPRINSLVEKYEMIPLQEWVGLVPEILYNEMNGYDFDLEFVGTKLDYDDLVTALKRARVTEDDVRCIHKRELDSRQDTLKDTIDLTSWLKDNRNHRFDFDTFVIENNDKLDNNQSIIIIGDTSLGEFVFDNTNISVELISNIEELDKTSTDDTPIIFEIERFSVQELKDGLLTLQEQNKVSAQQLFFFVSNKQSIRKYYRILLDLGVEKPKMINTVEDKKLKRYFEYYPVSNYIREYVKIVRSKYDSLNEQLEADLKESEEVNGEIMKTIRKIEDKIDIIEKAIEHIGSIKETKYEIASSIAKSNFISGIENWRSKKTKISNEKEAIKLAAEFEEETRYFYGQFIDELNKMVDSMIDEISIECRSCVENIDEESFNIVFEKIIKEVKGEFYRIHSDLLEIKEESYEKPKESLLNVFKKSNSNEEKEDVLVITYPCQKWREHVLDVVNPLIEENIRNKNDEVNKYRLDMTSIFMDKLNAILDKNNEKKSEVSKQLSDDILLLQQDSDWLKKFGEVLSKIERG